MVEIDTVGKMGVWQKYGAQIKEMRDRDHKSLQEIGDAVGVSREWIRQLLLFYCGTARVSLPEGTVNRTHLATELGVSFQTLEAWEARGKIKGLRWGRHVYYLPEEIEKARALADKRCLLCDRAVPQRFTYCPDCEKKHYRERRHQDYLRRKGYYQDYYKRRWAEREK